MVKVREILSSRVGVVGLVILLASTAASLSEAGQSQVDQDTLSGAELYSQGCAACHGSDGKGAQPSQVGFEVALPDFTDCRFASREPDSDWLAVVHEGGPARGFDRMMPAFGDAWSASDIQRSVDHVRRFCQDDAWPRGELNLPRPFVTEKAFPEDEAVFTTGVDAEGDGAVINTLLYEKRFGPRSQFEIALPFNAAELDGSWAGGVGDIAVGVKHALFHSAQSGSIFSLGGEVVFPTGDADRDLGKGTAIVEPYVSFGQILPADSFLQLQGGLELPTDTDKAENEAFWRATIGKSFTHGMFGRTWSPMVEVLGARELLEGEAVQWDLVPQVQVTLNTRQHVMVNVGARIPVTNTERRDVQVLAYLLWDWFDGGFLQGW